MGFITNNQIEYSFITSLLLVDFLRFCNDLDGFISREHNSHSAIVLRIAFELADNRFDIG